jgi:hypothetical protein
MLHLDPVLARAAMDLRLAESLHQAEAHRLVRQAHCQRPTWYTLTRILTRLGRVLILVGQRLQQTGSAPPAALEPREAAPS